MSEADLPGAVQRFKSDLKALAGAHVGRIGIAVSGGGDSLALLRLAALAYPGQVEAATVDHGLRSESGAEARHVAQVCVGLGCPHEILAVEVRSGGQGLQGEARAARYAALEQWAARRGIGLLLTAHHADDQAETLLMRLARGAGLSGLAGVRPLRPLPGGLPLARPLLGWRRQMLAEIAAPLAPVADPSNSDLRFDRVRMRQFLATSGMFDSPALARSAAALAECEEAIDWQVERLWSERASVEAGNSVRINADDLPRELRRRLLLRAITIFSEHAPRGDEAQRLLAVLDAGGVGTLAGVKCTGGTGWCLEPAPPRRKHG